MPANWENKILNYEVTPPESVWDSITQQLDKEDAPVAVKKIKEYEVTPPASVWNSITMELDKEEAPKAVVPVIKRNRSIIYWSAAAACAALIIISVTRYKNTASENSLPVANTAGKKDTSASVSSPEKLVTANDTTVTRKTIAIPQKKEEREELAAIEPTVRVETGYVKSTEVVPFTNNPFDNNEEKLANNNGDYTINTDLINSPDRYVIITGPNGSSKRVSVKLSAYIGYLNSDPAETEEPLDKIIKENALWKEKFKAWSNKLINTNLSPDISNFMDVFELSKLLSEK